jgi:hypothetical protein
MGSCGALCLTARGASHHSHATRIRSVLRCSDTSACGVAFDRARLSESSAPVDLDPSFAPRIKVAGLKAKSADAQRYRRFFVVFRQLRPSPFDCHGVSSTCRLAHLNCIIRTLFRLRCLLLLQRPHLRKQPSSADQFGMRPALHNPPVIHHDNLLRVNHRR